MKPSAQAQVPGIGVLQSPEQHSADVVQGSPGSKQVAACAGVGERMEVINGNDPAASPRARIKVRRAISGDA